MGCLNWEICNDQSSNFENELFNFNMPTERDKRSENQKLGHQN